MFKRKIYLAWKVPKSDSDDFFDWREKCVDILWKDKYEFISPLHKRAKEDDTFAVFWQCNANIKDSEIVLICADKKLWVWTAQEMLIAKYLKKPVITYLPKWTHHRKKDIVLTGKIIEDCIHPFIFESSDLIIESYDELELAIPKLLDLDIKDMWIIDKSIEHYKKLYL